MLGPDFWVTFRRRPAPSYSSTVEVLVSLAAGTVIIATHAVRVILRVPRYDVVKGCAAPSGEVTFVLRPRPSYSNVVTCAGVNAAGSGTVVPASCGSETDATRPRPSNVVFVTAHRYVDSFARSGIISVF